MKGKNKKLIAVFVVPVVLIAAVGGYFVMNEWEEKLPEVYVQEGFAEMTVEYQPTSGPQNSISYMRSSTATTHINNNSSLELNLTFAVVLTTDRRQEILIGLDVEGDFEEDLLPKTLELRARGHEGINVSSNLYMYRSIPGEVTGCSIQGGYGEGGWGTDTVTVGFDIDSHRFGVRSTEMYWIIPTSNIGNPYTLEIQAVVGGFAEEVVATVHVHIDLFSKITSFEASIDKEHYFTSDYSTEPIDVNGWTSLYYVQPEFTYSFENVPGGEDVLYDVEIYYWSNELNQWRRIRTHENRTVGLEYETTTTIHVHREVEGEQHEVRFLITQQDGNWYYDTQEDDEFEMTFIVTNDGCD